MNALSGIRINSQKECSEIRITKDNWRTFLIEVAGKDVDMEEMYGNAEWKERVEKWKAKQEKKGLVSKEDGDHGQDEEDDIL